MIIIGLADNADSASPLFSPMAADFRGSFLIIRGLMTRACACGQQLSHAPLAFANFKYYQLSIKMK